MTLLVKICGLRDARHVSAAVDAGADALGFVFAASVRRVTPADARTLCAAVPASVKRVAVMLHPTNDEWQHVLDDFEPDVLQTDAKDFASLDVPVSVERWPVYREGGDAAECATAFVYEGSSSGQGASVDWSRAADLAAGGQMILAGGLDAENVSAAIDAVRPMGVDVSSGVESARGQKDAGRILKFVHAVRTAERKT